jgi:hypothetical protein
MNRKPRATRPLTRFLRAVIEVAFILFLFYANLLMGEFNATNGRGKTLAFALRDIFTSQNFTIGLFAALIGYLVFEFLRRNLKHMPESSQPNQPEISSPHSPSPPQSQPPPTTESLS